MLISPLRLVIADHGPLRHAGRLALAAAHWREGSRNHYGQDLFRQCCLRTAHPSAASLSQGLTFADGPVGGEAIAACAGIAFVAQEASRAFRAAAVRAAAQ